MRVAAYCRVSSSSEDQLNSFAAQNIHYTQYITEHEDWRLVDIYADEGVTGTSVEKREDFKRMLDDSGRGLIDRILVKSISRFCPQYGRVPGGHSAVPSQWHDHLLREREY